MQERETKRMPDQDAAGWPEDDFSKDLGHGDEAADEAGTNDESRALDSREPLPAPLEDLDSDALGTVALVVEGARLRQGAVYVDLDDLERGPFRALGSQRAMPGQRLVPKQAVDFETWNRLVGPDAEPETVRPTEAG